MVKIIKESPYGEFNSDMRLAAAALSARRVPVELDTTARFMGQVPALAGYVSWGSNDREFDPTAYIP